MFEMRYLALAVCCMWVNMDCGQATSSQLQHWAEIKSDNARAKRSTENSDATHRDYDVESIVFAKLILRELARELHNENAAASRIPSYDANSDVAEVVAKRKPFWQPMGGPLPVETRLASFGTKIIPDDSHSAPNRFKAMRYGRR